jgi:hypothetical protein
MCNEEEFRGQLQFGKAKERLLAAWYIDNDGYCIFGEPNADGNKDRAPKIGNLIAPDRRADHPIFPPRYLEIKWKKDADLYRKTSKWQTGISLQPWLDYIQVQATQKTQVDICIILQKEDRIISASINQLYPHRRIYNPPCPVYPPGPSVFWDIDLPCWREVCTATELEKYEN